MRGNVAKRNAPEQLHSSPCEVESEKGLSDLEMLDFLNSRDLRSPDLRHTNGFLVVRFALVAALSGARFAPVAPAPSPPVLGFPMLCDFAHSIKVIARSVWDALERVQYFTGEWEPGQWEPS